MKFLAKWMYKHLKNRRLIQTEGVRRNLTRLHKGNATETEAKLDSYYIELLSKILWLLVLATGISLILWTVGQADDSGQLRFIREDYGGEEVEYTLNYQNEEKEIKQFTITLEPVRYRADELEEQFQRGFAYLEEQMLGDNESCQQIQKNMNLQAGIPDSGLAVSWNSDDYELIDERGIVNNQNLTKAQVVHLQLELSYEETTRSKEYEVVVQPKSFTAEEEEQRRIQLELEKLLQESVYEKEISISSDIQGVHITDANTGNRNPWMIVFFAVVISVMLWFRQKEELQNQVKKRNQELLGEYPYLVNQLVLYIGAGATVSGAFGRIIQQFETNKKKNGALFEELTVMWNEMHSGITQEQAYVNFGRRVGLMPYLKLMALLVQQIKKGTGGVVFQLEQEEHDAFEQKKERAKQLGETAGTKLLLPMIILMVISMIIVVCPAMMNFTI